MNLTKDLVKTFDSYNREHQFSQKTGPSNNQYFQRTIEIISYKTKIRIAMHAAPLKLGIIALSTSLKKTLNLNSHHLPQID
jgi:hypothetical protein